MSFKTDRNLLFCFVSGLNDIGITDINQHCTEANILLTLHFLNIKATSNCSNETYRSHSGMYFLICTFLQRYVRNMNIFCEFEVMAAVTGYSLVGCADV
jgi:hypothetical protein